MSRRDYNAEPPTREELAAFLKQARRDAGHTQYSAAQAIGTTVTSVSRWETGVHPIDGETLIAFLLLYEAVEPFVTLLTGERAARNR